MENLKKIRERKRITQLRLSIEADVAQETISAYESERSMPRVETLCKMADFLNVSTDFLLDRTDISASVNNLSIDGLNAREIELVSLFKKLSRSEQVKVIGYVTGMMDK